MHFWLVTNLHNSPSTQLVMKTCSDLGWTCEHIVPSIQNVDLTTTTAEKLLLGKKAQKPDFCFIRMGSMAPPEGFALSLKASSLGIPCFNSPDALVRLRDKAVGTLILASEKIPTPKTLVVAREYELSTLIEKISGPPWVLKTRYGTKGLGVMLVDSKRSLSSALDTLLAAHPQVLLQEFVAERSGTDVRVIVICGKAVAAMERGAASEEEFRSNLFLGGQGKPIELTKEIAGIAEAAACALGLTVAGVDLLGKPGGFCVAEVNTSPGLNGVSEAIGKNVAKEALLSFKSFVSTL